MRKYIWIFIASLAIPTMLSCSADETTEERLTSGAIGFSPLINHSASGKSTTRSSGTASIITDGVASAVFNGFYVWGYIMSSDNSARQNVAYLYRDGELETANGVPIAKAPSGSDFIGTGWGPAQDSYRYGYVTQNDLKYWPREQMEFFALGPIGNEAQSIYAEGHTNDVSNLSTALPTARPTDSKYSFTYKAEADNGATAADLSKHVDIVYATKRQTGRIGSSNVDLSFKHALSQVLFKGVVAAGQPGLTVLIKSVKLCNVNTQAIFTVTIPGTGTGEGQNEDGSTNTMTLTNDADNAIVSSVNGSYTLTPPENATFIELTSGADATIGDAKNLTNPILLIPQIHNAWKTGTKATADTGGSETTYLAIECAIFQVAGVPIVGQAHSESADGRIQSGSYYYSTETVYAKLVSGDATTITWHPGYSYVYNLNFGVGLNESGNPISTPITFTVTSVAGWTSGGTPEVPL